MTKTRAITFVLAALAPVAAADCQSTRRGNEQERRSARPVGHTSWEIRADVQEATRKGLAFLALNQSKAGFWAADVGFKVNANYRITKHDSAHVGITALALMAFLSCGEVPAKGKYGAVVERAVDYIVSCSEENGYLQQNGTRMYSHAFATLALAEVYGMTTRKDVREALQRSVNLISDSQNREGGWRYKPFAQESDMSITVCQVMALRAARNSGIFVPRNVIDRAVQYVHQSARAPGEPEYWRYARSRRYGYFNTGVFRYQKRHDARASFPLTAAGVTTLYGAGVYEHPLIERGLDFMSEKFATFNEQFRTHYFFYYGNYYAVQAFYIAGGDHWAKYYKWMRRFLIQSQQDDGSWLCTVGPGSSFATAVATIILSIPYQYLPIFQR